MAKWLAIVGWTLLLAWALQTSVYGPQEAKDWFKDYGPLFGALLAAAVTTVYVVITQEQLAATRLALVLQHGAGLVIGIERQTRTSPPALNLPSAYSFPEQYVQSALPNTPFDMTVQETEEYEVLLIRNTGEKAVTELELRVELKHNAGKERFEGRFSTPIQPTSAPLEIALWPTRYMPSYKLRVSGQFKDAIGKRTIPAQQVTR